MYLLLNNVTVIVLQGHSLCLANSPCQSAGPNTEIGIVFCSREHKQGASSLCPFAEEQSTLLHMQENGIFL